MTKLQEKMFAAGNARNAAHEKLRAAVKAAYPMDALVLYRFQRMDKTYEMFARVVGHSQWGDPDEIVIINMNTSTGSTRRVNALFETSHGSLGLAS